MTIERRRCFHKLLKMGVEINCYLGEIAKMQKEALQLHSNIFLAYNSEKISQWDY